MGWKGVRKKSGAGKDRSVNRSGGGARDVRKATAEGCTDLRPRPLRAARLETRSRSGGGGTRHRVLTPEPPFSDLQSSP